MKEIIVDLPAGKKLYFSSDYHLGVPDEASSLERERKVCRWLDQVSHDAGAIYLLGDIFDFWFEYRHSIPRGFMRLQAKLTELRDKGIPITFFTGNHDMWMFDYFPTQLGIVIHREPVVLCCGQQRLLIGHGDGLGPGERGYKFLKAFFNSGLCQWLFARIHPNLGMSIAHFWSRQSRVANMKREETFLGADREYLLIWCKEQEALQHHDYYIFGHRHLPLDLEVSPNSRYLNTGEWVHQFTYAVYDGQKAEVLKFESSAV